MNATNNLHAIYKAVYVYHWKERAPAIRSNFSSPGSSDSDTELDVSMVGDTVNPALTPPPESHAKAKKVVRILNFYRGDY